MLQKKHNSGKPAFICGVFFSLMAVLWGPSSSAQDPASTPLVIGEQIEFGSVILDEVRIINVYFPPDYPRDDTTRYPVVVVLDGGIQEDFLHISGLTQHASFPWVGWMEECIVIGVVSPDRRHDFTTPALSGTDKADFPTSGGAEDFAAFLESELVPWVHKHYQTDGTATLIGQSLAGLETARVLIHKPGLFQRYIIVSPSIWWNNNELLLATTSAEGRSDVEYIYIAVGKEEKEMRQGARLLYNQVKKEFPGARIVFDYLPDEDHGSILHPAVMRAFRSMKK